MLPTVNERKYHHDAGPLWVSAIYVELFYGQALIGNVASNERAREGADSMCVGWGRSLVCKVSDSILCPVVSIEKDVCGGARVVSVVG